MSVDWVEFTPLAAAMGGVLIGLGVALLLFFNGKIAGISGIVAGLLVKPRSFIDTAWKIAFVAGLIAAPSLYAQVHQLPRIVLTDNFVLLAAAGLLTGIGTGLASGCTSGHGVCGLSRLSPRSLIATLCFMGTGFLTVFVVRHVLNGLSL